MVWLLRLARTRTRLACWLLSSFVLSGCYTQGDGTAPPPDEIYFPVGLTVSRGGNVLYVINSDFDLQWNGGTLQSYDLHQIRRDTVLAIQDPTNPNLPLANPPSPAGSCPGNPPSYSTDGSGLRQPLGQTCAPQTRSTRYFRDSATIGAFATDLQLSTIRHDDKGHIAGGTRLFAPVRGDGSLTWADVVPDDPLSSPPADADVSSYPPFKIDCGTREENRCDAGHHAGTNPNEPGNTRFLTMPGEPFGMAQSDDGTAIAITHQTDTKTSLLTTAIDANGNALPPGTMTPSLQFILDGLPTGGSGIIAIPHDPEAFDCVPGAGACMSMPGQAFLETNLNVAQLVLLRFYADQDQGNAPSSLLRPFLVNESTISLTANASGTDSRGIAIDTTQRLACKAQVLAQMPGAKPTDPTFEAALRACARIPARLFFANRAPQSLIVGEVGQTSVTGDGTYDADAVSVFESVPLSLGPSRVYLAPIVNRDGTYALRVFIVCFDSATIYVYDPDADAVEAIISTGLGPYAMAFDPFQLRDVAVHAPVALDGRDPDLDLKVFRFAYVASFTDSYIQVIDLDNSPGHESTFETVVYTMGTTLIPKGSQ